jgi:diguanylate cyclase (GGDEF)-like protein
MERKEARRRKERGILLASGGLLLAIAVALGLRLLGASSASYRDLGILTLVVVGVEVLGRAVVRSGWADRLRWDPHFVYVPMLTAICLLDALVYVAYDARVLVFLAWYCALLFVAGTAGLRGVILLASTMTVGYLLAMGLLVLRGQVLHLAFDLTVIGVFMISNLYAAVVFESLRREREEMTKLRRQLAQLAATDHLTGLLNRRQFEDALRSELGRVERYGASFAVAMIDVDYFKNYNDSLGHVSGDNLLRLLAQIMRAELRAIDIVARYGGEEFTVVMVRTSKADGIQTIERLRAAVETHPFHGRESQPGGQVTISAGVAGCPDDGSTYEALVARADEALYRAKREGRNRVQGAAY